jgi:hypothetical protein
MPADEHPADGTPARPGPANVAATLLLWSVLGCAGLAALCLVLGRLMTLGVSN